MNQIYYLRLNFGDGWIENSYPFSSSGKTYPDIAFWKYFKGLQSFSEVLLSETT